MKLSCVSLRIVGIGRGIALTLLAALAGMTLAACTPSPERVEVTREISVEVTRVVPERVEITREVQVPVTRIVPEPVEVTRVVQVPVTRVVAGPVTEVVREVEVPVEVEVIKEVIVEVPVEVIREVIVEVPVQATSEPEPTPLPQAQLTGRIAYTSMRDGNEEIYVMNVDGTELSRLTFHPLEDYAFDWSRDGGRLAFNRHDEAYGGVWRIYTMTPDGQGVSEVSSANWDWRDSSVTPAFSPDGNSTAFVSQVGRSSNDDKYDIWLLGSNNRATRLGVGVWPRWSPNSGQIVFAADAGPDNEEIYVMRRDGSNRTRLTNSSGTDSRPDWSPDGSRIAFMSRRDGNFEIYAMNTDGSGVTRLTNSPTYEGLPRWSPDGQWIMFYSNRGGGSDEWDLYAMRPDGSDVVRITRFGDISFTSFAWGPADQ